MLIKTNVLCNDFLRSLRQLLVRHFALGAADLCKTNQGYFLTLTYSTPSIIHRSFDQPELLQETRLSIKLVLLGYSLIALALGISICCRSSSQEKSKSEKRVSIYNAAQQGNEDFSLFSEKK